MFLCGFPPATSIILHESEGYTHRKRILSPYACICYKALTYAVYLLLKRGKKSTHISLRQSNVTQIPERIVQVKIEWHEMLAKVKQKKMLMRLSNWNGG